MVAVSQEKATYSAWLRPFSATLNTVQLDHGD